MWSRTCHLQLIRKWSLRKMEHTYSNMRLQTSILLALTLCAALQASADPSQRFRGLLAAINAATNADAALNENGVLGSSPADILSRLSTEQKVGQLIQAEISSISLDDIRRFGIGSVLNGGGSYPNGRRSASVEEWRNFATAIRKASLDTSLGSAGIPIVWGTDAVHGHNNVRGAVLFPHNIGLGAANDVALIEQIGAATARAVAATGIDWIFGPTVAQAQDLRWGRSYESYSNDSDLVRSYAHAMVSAIQREGIAATAKHFIGDGGTERGIDQGNTTVDDAQLLTHHASGYEGAIDAQVLSVMASFNSIRGEKIHGNRAVLTDILRAQLGFRGLVVGDWNGIAQVPGCTAASCPRAFNAGIDLSMTPYDWKALRTNLLEEIRRGDISTERLDEAVLRVLEFKHQLGLLDADHSVNRGVPASTLGSPTHRSLARAAVHKSLVLLKNNKQALPVSAAGHIALAGSAADSIPHQAGGWSVTWQGTGTSNDDFPGATTIRTAFSSAIQAAGGSLHFSASGNFAEELDLDAIFVVLAEDPYAEGQGDLNNLDWPASRSRPLSNLQSFRERNIPVITVLMSGRPLWVNPEINQSDAVVAAWLPGTEGQGIVDVLLTRADGTASDFSGTLPFAWPGAATNALGADKPVNAELFPPGYGLTYADPSDIGTLCESPAHTENGLPEAGECEHSAGSNTAAETIWIFRNGELTSLMDRGIGAFDEAIGWGVCENDGGDACPSIDWVMTDDVERGKVLEAYYPYGAAFAGLFMESYSGLDLSHYESLNFDIKHVSGSRQYAIKLDCFYPCTSGDYFFDISNEEWTTISVPISTLEAQGLDISNVNTGLVIWSQVHDGDRFRIDNVRFTPIR